MDARHVIDQADQRMHAAKHLGRDRVVRFDQCPQDIASDTETQDKLAQEKIQTNIQNSSVTGHLLALSFRRHETAKHSVRVTELAVKVEATTTEHAEGRLDPRSAAIIGRHSKMIYESIAEEDWVVVQDVTQDLRLQASDIFTASSVEIIDEL